MCMRGSWTATGVALFICALFYVAGCPKQLKTAGQAARALATSPRLVSVKRTVYDISQAEWGLDYFSTGLYQNKPIVAYRSASGLSLAVANTSLPQNGSDWQVLVIDSQPKIRFIYLAGCDEGVFVSYLAGSKESSHPMLASCLDENPADPQNWALEELPEELVNALVQSLAVSNGRLGLVCSDRETRMPLYICRDLTTGGGDWTVEVASESLSGARSLTLLDLGGVPVVGCTSEDHTSLGLLVSPSQEVDSWHSTLIASDAAAYFSPSGLDFAAQGNAIGAVFHQGEKPILRFAITADATATRPDWLLSNIVDWDMLGAADLLFHDGLPVVVYEAEDALFAFLAATKSPASFRGWRMCQLSEDLGVKGYNGVEALIIDDHLLATYLKLDIAGNTTLSATVIKIPD